MSALFTKNSTLATDAPPLAVANAVSVVGELTGTVDPAEGEVKEIVGGAALPTVTDTAGVEVCVALVESMTRAVRLKLPVVVGTQEKV
jgi:hypothetical protein